MLTFYDLPLKNRCMCVWTNNMFYVNPSSLCWKYFLYKAICFSSESCANEIIYTQQSAKNHPDLISVNVDVYFKLRSIFCKLGTGISGQLLKKKLKNPKIRLLGVHPWVLELQLLHKMWKGASRLAEWCSLLRSVVEIKRFSSLKGLESVNGSPSYAMFTDLWRTVSTHSWIWAPKGRPYHRRM